MGAKKKTTKKKANLSTERPKGRSLPFDKLKAPSTAEGPKVHPEPRSSAPPSKAELRAAERVKVKILRSKPWEGEKAKAKYETYEVPLEGKTSVLNVLTYIAENLDPTLGFYSSCRIGKCMGCQVVVNGKVKLACTTPVVGDIALEPLRQFKVIKDLVVERKGKE